MEKQDDRASESLAYVSGSDPASAAPKVSSAEVGTAGCFRGPAVSIRPPALRRLGYHEIKRMLPWGNFPERHRRYYIAQNGKCPYCGDALPLIGPPRNLCLDKLRPRDVLVPTADHVRPKSQGGKLSYGNKVVAHAVCNRNKDNRKPHPCEILFAEITGELVVAMLPLTAFSTYIPAQQISQEPEAHGEEDNCGADHRS